MTENWAKWASEHGQITKIRLSDGCGGKTITTAAQFGYDRHGFEGYLGNVGLGQFGRWAFAEFTEAFEIEAEFGNLINGLANRAAA